MKPTNNPPYTQSNGNGPLNNHMVMVWMRSFPLCLTWVETHSGLKIGSIIVNVTFVGSLLLFHLWNPPWALLWPSLPPSYPNWPQWLPSIQHLS